jgi:hypothetical protein
MTISGRPGAAWYPDPTGRHQHRYWDGDGWTLHVADDGVAATEGGAPQPVAEQPVVQQPTAPEARPATHWEPSSTSGWTDGAATSKPMYATQVSSPATGWQVPPTATSSASSSARGWIVGIAFLVAIVGIGATAMLALGRNDGTGTSATADGQHYPAAVETNFMTGCTSSGGNTNYCRCALDHLEQDYDLAEFADAEQSYKSTGKLPDSMMSAVTDCLHYLLPQQQ